MIYTFLVTFGDQFSFLSMFSSLGVRVGCAFVLSLVVSFVFFPYFIRWLRRRQGSGQPIYTEVLPSHETKKGTPTMGGFVILVSTSMGTLLCADLSSVYLWLVVLVMWGYGILGMLDDYIKLTKRRVRGLSVLQKLFVQIFLALLGVLVFVMVAGEGEEFSVTSISIPFLKGVVVDLGVFFVVFGVFVVVGSSNAVNLTDGLDGLAIVLVMMGCIAFMVIVLLVSDVVWADALRIRHIPDTEELMILCGALLGGGLGFLWFNTPPALIFMGDTGSLSLGGVLGMLSIVTKHEFVWSIIGGIFVLETVSVVLQILSARFEERGYIGRRIFLVAPLHHHFERLGWSETTIVIRFWIIGFILALLGLSTLVVG